MFAVTLGVFVCPSNQRAAFRAMAAIVKGFCLVFVGLGVGFPFFANQSLAVFFKFFL